MENQNSIRQNEKVLRNLEKRISRIEAHLELEISSYQEDSQIIQERSNEDLGALLEHKISENWFAKAGVIVISIGFAFLLTFKFEKFPSFVPVLFGYLLVVGIYSLAHYWRKSNSHISGQLVGGGLALLYFTTLRLHFFSDIQIIQDRYLEVILLNGVVIAGIILSIRRKSIYLTGLGLILGYITATISSDPAVMFTSLSFLAAATVYISLKYQWKALIFLSIILTYFTHFVWFLGNPVIGSAFAFQSEPNYNLLFIIIYTVIFSLSGLFENITDSEGAFLISSSFLNCMGSYGLIIILTLSTFKDTISSYNLIASIIYLGIAVVFWVRHKSVYSTFFYSMLGYTALSVMIIAQFTNPEFFILLGWQSLVVISTAILFRSKFIIVANFIIYVLILITYLIFASGIDAMILSFGVISLSSARILNWQKDSLKLKTELMRYAYLVSAFFIIPYSLYKLFPGLYVSLSWIGLTMLYYLMSIVLKNNKYRWMAILTLILTIFYVLTVDLINLDPAYRIISFFVLGIVLIAISVIYNNSNQKNKEKAIPEYEKDMMG